MWVVRKVYKQHFPGKYNVETRAYDDDREETIAGSLDSHGIVYGYREKVYLRNGAVLTAALHPAAPPVRYGGDSEFVFPSFHLPDYSTVIHVFSPGDYDRSDGTSRVAWWKMAFRSNGFHLIDIPPECRTEGHEYEPVKREKYEKMILSSIDGFLDQRVKDFREKIKLCERV